MRFAKPRRALIRSSDWSPRTPPVRKLRNVGSTQARKDRLALKHSDDCRLTVNSPNETHAGGGPEKVKGRGCLLAAFLLVLGIALALLLFWVLSPAL